MILLAGFILAVKMHLEECENNHQSKEMADRIWGEDYFFAAGWEPGRPGRQNLGVKVELQA